MSLDKIPDLIEFLDLPLAGVLQGLHMPTTLRTNLDSSRSRCPKDPRFNARSKMYQGPKTRRMFWQQPRIRFLHFQWMQLQLFRLLQLPLPVNLPSRHSSFSHLDFLEEARLFAESMTRQVAFTQTPSF